MDHVPLPKRLGGTRAAGRPSGPPDIGDFLRSRQGKRLQEKVIRGVFGMLRKRL